jgi:hypothetical protein
MLLDLDIRVLKTNPDPGQPNECGSVSPFLFKGTGLHGLSYDVWIGLGLNKCRNWKPQFSLRKGRQITRTKAYRLSVSLTL